MFGWIFKSHRSEEKFGQKQTDHIRVQIVSTAHVNGSLHLTKSQHYFKVKYHCSPEPSAGQLRANACTRSAVNQRCLIFCILRPMADVSRPRQ